MAIWNQLRRVLQFLVVATLLYSAWIFASRHSGQRRRTAQPSPSAVAAAAAFDRVYGGSELKILQFYAREGSMTEGSPTVICYGVLNARSVKIEPPLDGVFVALNRCLSAAPSRDTEYTLTAEGNDGRTISASLVLSVRPDQATLPRIGAFQIVDRKPDYRGRNVFLLHFEAANAETVDIDPPAFPTLHGAPLGNFYVAPEKTTTYTLTATGKYGHKARRQLTVAVP